MTKRRVVFSSVGDTYDLAWKSWWTPNRTYEVMLVYYGSNVTRFTELQKHSDVCFMHAGSKLQNLQWVLTTHPAALPHEYLWVVDDDIVLESKKINALFDIGEAVQLPIISPTFSRTGRISYKHMISKEENQIRYTNFIEIGTPLFSRTALIVLMKKISPQIDAITGWGVDYLCTELLYTKDLPFGLVDSIVVRNPHAHERSSKKREVVKFGNESKRWRKVSQQLNVNFSVKRKDIKSLGTKLLETTT